MNITDSRVSNELFARQGDDRYADLASMKEDASERKRLSKSLHDVNPKHLAVVPHGENSYRILHTRNDDLPSLRLTNYSLGQLCTATRAPMELLQRLSPETGAKALTEALHSERTGMSDRQLLIDTRGDQPTLRAMTSERYGRVWDVDVIASIERWLTPVGYKPATPTMNLDDTDRPSDIFGDDRPALWMGDRDSFSFFYTEPDPNGNDFGGLRGGIYLGNSEVGAGSLQWKRFLFREMCANFNIWGGTAEQSSKRRHVGDAYRIFAQFNTQLRAMAESAQPLPLKRIEIAATTAFVGDGSATDANRVAAVEKLCKEFGAGKGVAAAAVSASLEEQNAPMAGLTDQHELSAWTICNGLTWTAKDTRYASRVVEGGKLAEKVLASVEVD